MTFTELRQQYPKFIFHGYDADYRDGSLHVVYRFEIPGLYTFAPAWTIPCERPAIENPALSRLLISLGMAELVSYWKITCSPVVQLPIQLTEQQANWWKRLYFGGLGELFYRNGIQTDFDSFMTFSYGDAVIPYADVPQKPLSGKLIPVGGGKDSIVTLNLLKEQLGDAFAYQINHRDSSEQAALLAGIPKDRILEPKRTLDPNMLECNRRGFLNGHTPFSAIVAFSSVLTAYLHGLSEVVLSNESSASESTVTEAEVNHQYSKSYQFEQDFFAYERDYLRCGIRYYSLLRPLTEFQIARYFASLPTRYHEIFRSCNAGAKQDAWCGHCPKCLFVSVILSPFLPLCEIVRLIGADLLNMEEMEPVLQELCGALPNKPFECVGSRKEVNISLCLAIEKAEREGEKLPLLLKKYKQSEQYAEYAGAAADFGQEWDPQHNLTDELAALVRRECVDKFA